MSWELDEAQQQALLRVVAAANQNPGADSEDDDHREVCEGCGALVVTTMLAVGTCYTPIV